MKDQPAEPYHFDLKRIFLGDMPIAYLGEVAFRTVIIYAYTLALIRLLGKRGLGQLSAFDFVIVIALGSAVGDPMFYEDVPLVHSMATITVVVLLQRFVGWVTARSKTAERYIESEPRRLVHRGVVDVQNLRHEQLESEELFAALRIQGVRQLGEVELAYIEPSGTISVLESREPEPGRPLLARSDPDFPRPFGPSDRAPASDQYACDDCGQRIALRRGDAFPPACVHCRCERWLRVAETVFHRVEQTAPSEPTGD